MEINIGDIFTPNSESEKIYYPKIRICDIVELPHGTFYKAINIDGRDEKFGLPRFLGKHYLIEHYVKVAPQRQLEFEF